MSAKVGARRNGGAAGGVKKRGAKRKKARRSKVPEVDRETKIGAMRALLEMAHGAPLALSINDGEEDEFLRALRAGAPARQIRRLFHLTIEELAGACIRALTQPPSQLAPA